MMKWLRRAEQAGAPAEEERLAWSAEIPGVLGKALCTVQVEVIATPQGAGRHWSVRGRVHTRMSALRGPAAGDRALADGGSLPVQRWLGDFLERRPQPAWLKRLTEPLMQLDFHTWLEIRASTAPLANGAHALLPETERLATLGVAVPAGDGPVAKTWAGENPGARGGFAQVSLLRFGKRDLPRPLAALLGARPLHVAGALINVVEEGE